MRFTGKTVLITGAGSGIGAAAARRFASEGANVVLNGRRAEKLAEVAAGLDPARTLVHASDASVEAEVEALVAATVARFGGLDVLIANAGVFAGSSADKTSTADWRTVMATNLDGVFFAARASLPHLIAARGNIVSVASVSGLGADWGAVAYNASKGGVVNLTRAMALDNGRHGVRVNSVCPSLTITDMTVTLTDNAALMAKFAERIPLGRAATADEVASVIAFLASDDAAFVTGVNLPVDGGVGASDGQPRFG